MPGSWTHLGGRFFAVLLARSLDGDELAWIGSRLGDDLLELFQAQPRADQRHGLDAARYVAAVRPDAVDLIETAALHDVGKRHSGLGVFGRVAASLAIRLRVRLPATFRVYRDHGEIGAEELERLGAAPVTIEFARHHHGERPPSIPSDAWELLTSADGEPLTRRRMKSPIT